MEDIFTRMIAGEDIPIPDILANYPGIRVVITPNAKFLVGVPSLGLDVELKESFPELAIMKALYLLLGPPEGYLKDSREELKIGWHLFPAQLLPEELEPYLESNLAEIKPPPLMLGLTEMEWWASLDKPSDPEPAQCKGEK